MQAELNISAKRSFIHHDQIGSTPGTQRWLNKQKLINVIYHIGRLKGVNTHAIMCLWQSPTTFYDPNNGEVRNGGNIPWYNEGYKGPYR